MSLPTMIGSALVAASFVAGAAFADISYDDAVSACNSALAEKLEVSVDTLDTEVRSWRTRGRYMKLNMRNAETPVYCEVHVSSGAVKTLDVSSDG